MIRRRRDPALSFGQAAAHYDAIRPTYPAEAVRWAIGSSDRDDDATGTVVDLGAGTGLLTRVMVGVTGSRVVPVEPDPQMRDQLARSTEGVTPLAGTAESIPLPDATVDAVLAGQAYHWFDPQLAHPEIARVLRSGGVFAPMWNIRDESVPWVAEFSARVGETHSHGIRQARPPDYGPLFDGAESTVLAHAVPMDAAGLVALLASRSYYLTARPRRQERLRHEIMDLAATLPETFEMPYQTYVYRARRVPR